MTIPVTLGIAAAYFALVADDILLMATAVVAGAIVGTLLMKHGANSWPSRLASSRWPLITAVTLALLMIVVIYPDAVVGIVPQEGSSGSTASFGMGVHAYAGGYMDSALGRTKGVSLTVSFAGTNLSSIQPDNYLAAGLGVHSPGCCVDGIDYGYRHDAYLFRNGNEVLVASAWEVCDYVSACGGHSWKVLMFLNSSEIGVTNLSSEIHLTVEWIGHTVYWAYGVGAGPLRNMTSFAAPPQENPDFDIGVASGSGGESGHYFFQFGIMSRFPIGKGGWSVTMGCPAYLAEPGWVCVEHASTIQGGESYWKLLWKWGEDYPHVEAVSSWDQPVVFAYSPSTTMKNFETLW